MTDSTAPLGACQEDDTGWSAVQLEALTARALDGEYARAAGFVSVRTMAAARKVRVERLPQSWFNGFPGILCPWRSPLDGSVEWQLRPDRPKEDRDGRPKKYVWPNGVSPRLNAARLDPRHERLLLVEGTFQTAAVARYAPADCAVIGMIGCWGWSHEGSPLPDLRVVSGRDVTVMLDSDVQTNPRVYEAARALDQQLLMDGARSVQFVILPSSGEGPKAGIDDVLGSRRPDERGAYLDRTLKHAAVPIKKIKKPARPKKSEEQDERREKAYAADRERAEQEGRPLVSLAGDRLIVRRTIEAALASKYPDTFFRRGASEQLVVRDGAELQPVSPGRLMTCIQMAMRTGKPIRNPLTEDTGWQDEDPTQQTITALLGGYADWPRLESVTETPFIRPDGTMCVETGYDESTRTYLVNTLELEVPDCPTELDVRSAVKLLRDEWMGDLLLQSEEDRTLALALMITPFVRQMFDTCPLFVVDGNRPATGKGLLLSIFGQLALGHPTPLNALPGDDEEVRKSITSLLLMGANVIAWDEVTRIQGKVMSQLITAGVWSDRLLGASTVVQLENRATFVAAGNNIGLKGDLFRRVVRIRLETDMERPQDRDSSSFRHPDLGAWTRENRGDLVSAVFTLVRAWVQAGRPHPSGGMGSFEGWYATVGGVLTNAGLPFGLQGTRDWADRVDEDRVLWSDHLIWLEAQFGSSPFTVRQVCERLESDPDAPILELSIPGWRGTPTELRYRNALGREYARQVGVWTAERALGVAGRHRENISRYTVVHRWEGVDEGIVFSPKTVRIRSEGRVYNSEKPGLLFGEAGSIVPEAPVYDRHYATEGGIDSPPYARARVRVTGAGDEGLQGPFPSDYREKDTTHIYDDRALVGLAPADGPCTPVGPASCDEGGVARMRDARVRDYGLFARPLVFEHPSESPADLVLSWLSEPMDSECPACGSAEVLIDGLWFACPKCDPDTAQRGTEEWMR